jgi:hypothetical protein
MATKELIQTVTIGSAGATTIEFTNIPQGFTDLLIVASTRAGAGAVARNMNIRFNASTLGYSERMIDSNGSSASSANTSGSLINWSFEADSGATTSTFSNISLYVPNYSSVASYKSMVIHSSSENNGSTGYNRLTSGLWTSNSPITSVSLIAESGSSFVQYSSASLYGFRRGSDGATTPSTTGGTIVVSGGYTFHVFTSSGTFSPTRSLVIDGVVIGGGGGGAGGAGGGGGGGGGYQAITTRTISKGSYSVVIGAGGTNGTGSVMAGNGGDSSFLDITSFGGAGGGQTDGAGRNGASGSGNGSFRAGGGLGIAGQGNNGGDAGSGSPYNAGGGGGAAAAGSGQNGGAGAFLPAYTFPTSTGVSGYLAGGGGGGTYYAGNSVGSGGTGGGGAGTNSNGSATSGTANTGGGGGGSGNQYNNGQGSTGGSGIVIIRYPTPA